MLKRKVTLNNEIDNFLFNWNSFPIDFWWRKKYNVPFGSKQHREMNFIDMAIEWRENIAMLESIKVKKSEEDEDSRMSKEEIDKEYENIDLSQFDKK